MYLKDLIEDVKNIKYGIDSFILDINHILTLDNFEEARNRILMLYERYPRLLHEGFTIFSGYVSTFKQDINDLHLCLSIIVRKNFAKFIDLKHHSDFKMLWKVFTTWCKAKSNPINLKWLDEARINLESVFF